MLILTVVLQGAQNSLAFMRKLYRESYIVGRANRLVLNFIGLFKKSYLAKLLRSRNYDYYEVREDYSTILMGYYGGLTENIRVKLKTTIDNNCLLRLIIDNKIQLYLLIVIVIFAPFTPTLLGLVLGLLCLFFVAIRLLFRGTKFIYPKAYLLFSIIFLISIVIASLYNFSPNLTHDSLPVYLVYISLGLTTPYIICDRYRFDLFLILLTIVTGLLCLYGAYQYIFGLTVNEGWTDIVFGPNLVRIYSVFGNPNVFGEYLLLLFPITLGLFINESEHRYKFIYFIIMGLAFVNILMTLSRGSILGLIVSVFIILILKDKKYLLLGILTSLVIIPFIPQTIIMRVLSILNGKDGSTNYRKSIYRASLNMIRDNPVSGIGLGQFRDAYKVYSFKNARAFHAHNTYLMIFIELGILGIMSFALMLLTWFSYILSSLRHNGCKINTMVVCIFAGLVGCSIQGLVDHIWHNYDIMLMYFFMLGLGIAGLGLIHRNPGEING